MARPIIGYAIRVAMDVKRKIFLASDRQKAS